MRVAKGQFAKGHSGNPAGRKRGSGTAAKYRAEIEKHVPEIIGKLVALAGAGNVKAAHLLLERVLPPLKAEAGVVALPELAAAQGLVAQSESVVRAVAEQRLAPDTAALLIAALAQHGKLVEIEELERRIAALEGEGHHGTTF